MAMPQITEKTHATAMRAIGNDPLLAEMLGLAPYVGNNSRGTRGGTPKQALREVAIVSEEQEERAKLGLGGFYRGFNNGLGHAGVAM